MYIPKRMKLALAVFSLFSRLVSRCKNLFYDRGVLSPRRAPIPVISVGNISLGGSGKTPLAMELLSRLLASGRRPSLISRAYRGRWERPGGVLSDGRTVLGTWQDGGDEPYLIARTFPAVGVYVGKDRLASCRRAAASGFDVAVLDDGFQHRRLAREVDIVLYSSKEKVALREPVSALRRADILLVKSSQERARALHRLGGRWTGRIFCYSIVIRNVSDLRTGEHVPVERLAKMKLLAFCGIARPAGFAETLREAGLGVVSLLPFPDHHPYPPASRQKIILACRSQGADALVTTGKDGVKLVDRIEEWGDIPVFILEIGLTVEPGFDECWRAFLQKRTA